MKKQTIDKKFVLEQRQRIKDRMQKTIDLAEDFKIKVNTPKNFLMQNRMYKTIELAEQYQTDPEKDKRIKVSECPVCYYIKERIGGDALTDTQCAGCKKILSFSNTNTDKLCLKCASHNNLCKHCGAYLKGIYK